MEKLRTFLMLFLFSKAFLAMGKLVWVWLLCLISKLNESEEIVVPNEFYVLS